MCRLFASVVVVAILGGEVMGGVVATTDIEGAKPNLDVPRHRTPRSVSTTADTSSPVACNLEDFDGTSRDIQGVPPGIVSILPDVESRSGEMFCGGSAGRETTSLTCRNFVAASSLDGGVGVGLTEAAQGVSWTDAVTPSLGHGHRSSAIAK